MDMESSTTALDITINDGEHGEFEEEIAVNDDITLLLAAPFVNDIKTARTDMKYSKSTSKKSLYILLMGCAAVLVILVTVIIVFSTRNANFKPLIVVSLDGFHPKYLEWEVSPTLNALRQQGMSARWMTPVFPTKTFPSHYSIATGLLPEHHGIVLNNFCISGSKDCFDLKHGSKNSSWWFGEPIWVTAETQGVKTGISYWPGSEARIHDMDPTFVKNYGSKMTNDERMKEVIDWFTLPADKKRPDFVMIYMSDVDTAGHKYGIDKPKELTDAIKSVDSSIKLLMDGLSNNGIDPNIIILSDHGMTTKKAKKVQYLEDYVHNSVYKSLTTTKYPDAISFLEPNAPYTEEELLQKLSAIPNMTVWRRSEIPAKYKYRTSNRIGPIVGLASLGWLIGTEKGETAEDGGQHGYDNFEPDMQSIFIANGPNIRVYDEALDPFLSLDVYNLMTRILGIKAASNNGTEHLVDTIFKG